jgi:PAS domain S-box-containing protein
MTSPYAYSPTLLPLLLVAVFLIALSVYSWRHRSTPGALPFSLGWFLWTLWLLGIIGELAAVDYDTKRACFTFQALWHLPTATAFACFMLEYVNPGKVLTRGVLLVLAAPLLVQAALILTNQHHQLVWRGIVQQGPLLHGQTALVGWSLVLYALVLAAVQLVALGWLFARSPEHRSPAALMAFGLLAARGIYILNLFYQQPLLGLELPILTLAIPAVTYSAALFGFRIFDPRPIARRTVIEQLSSGVLVFDADGRAVSANPAAEQIVGLTSAAAAGRPWREILPAPALLPDGEQVDLGSSSGPAVRETSELLEMTVGRPGGARCYSPTLSPLIDFRGVLIGHVLTLRDVTAQKRAQEQAVNHQRVLAVLQERERLARELHDGVAQTLAAAFLQANTARMFLAQGKRQQVDDCLDDLVEATHAAQDDIREYLLGVKTLYAGHEGFGAALREYVERFSRQYGLSVHLVIPPELEKHGALDAVEVQLLRIIQEALTNVRKHGHVQATSPG